MLGASQGFSHKKCSRTVIADDVEQRRASFAGVMKGVGMDQVISIDETAVYVDMKPSYGYSKRGKRCMVSQSKGWRQHFTVLMAVSNRSVLGYKIIKGACDRNTFAEFVEGLRGSGRSLLLLDNAAIHKGASVLSAARSAGLEPWYLPPYSPMFQPIEHVFSGLKASYRRLDASLAVPERVRLSASAVSGAGLDSTFRHCWDVARSWPCRAA